MAIRAVGGVALRRAAGGRVELLVIRKRGGFWTLPKGRVKRGESDEAALIRELREETGLGGRVLELVSQSSYKVLKQGQLRRKVVVYYLVDADPGEPVPGSKEQIEAVCWVDVARALKQIGRPRVRSIVRSALTLLNP